MGFFDRFKKKNTPHYDSTNIQVQDLDVGFIFDYDLSSWEVKALYEYDWGNNFFTREFQISDGSQTLYLSLEEDDEVILTISKKFKVGKLGSAVVDALMDFQKPPKRITFDEVTYAMTKEAPGYFRDVNQEEDWEEFVSWDFEDEEEKHVLCIEQWGEKEFEFSAGKYIKEFEISNILPANN